MKIETVALDDQQTKLIAEFDNDTLEKYKHQAARKISQNQKIPGFRPGKAPYDLVRRIVGDDALQQEAIELMLDVVYPEVIKEANINPSGPGKLEEIVKMDPPTFAFVVPLPPEVQLGDYKEIRKEYELEPVTDEQVEATVRRLLRSYAVAEPVERAAEQGDLVAFKLSAKRTQPEEGQPETLVEETPYQMVAGEDEEVEEAAWPYEGFSQELVGLNAGDTKTVVHTFNEESPYEDLRGKEAEFHITVESIKEMHLPELNDEFAQSLGEFENLEALRKAIRTQLEQQSSQQYDQNYYDELVSDLVDQATIKYPPHMLEEEVEEFLHGLEHNLEHDHLDLETYLKMRELTREQFIENEVQPAARRRLERSLALEEFAKQENIQVKNEEVQSIFYSAVQQLQMAQEQNKGKGRKNQDTREMANTLAINTVNSIFNQRMMSRLKAIATGKGDEQPEEAQSLLEARVDAEAATDTGDLANAPQLDAPAEVLPPESEAGLEEVQMSSITSEQDAEEEQDVAEKDLLEEEPPQAEKNAGEDE